MLNRKVGPHITNDFDLRIGSVKSINLQNGLELHELNTGSQKIIKIELVFRAGRIHEELPAIAKAAIRLLKEGPADLGSEETAHIFDFHGAVFKAECHMEYAAVSLVCLTEHFDKVWPVWLNAITNPAFELEALEKYKELSSRKLKEQLVKNDVIAYRSFTEMLFGSAHPYGYNTTPEHIEALQQDQLKRFFNMHCQWHNAFAVLSGNYDDKIRDRLLFDLGSKEVGASQNKVSFPPSASAQGKHLISSDNVHQTSIKTGKLWVPRKHEDYVGLMVLNTVLGGYFGSRLMRNIREEKGYTYGIYSSFDAWQEDGYFYISSEVGNEYVEPTMKELEKEINELKNKRVEEAELKMVKNYLLGQSLNLIDGPFATAQLVKSLRAKALDLNTFSRSVEEIKLLQSDNLIELANKYFDTSDFLTILVGNN